MHSVRWRSLALAMVIAVAATLLLPATAATASIRDDIGSGDYLIAIFYDRVGYDAGGDILLVWAPRPCTTTTSDLDYYLRDLPINGSGWNDKISSFKTFNHCDVALYEHIDFRGARFPTTGWGDYSANLGWYGWDNRASSIKFS
jgi:hypothetical protein